MGLGIYNITNTSMEQINYMVNSSSVPEFFVKANYTIFNGYFWFIMMWVLFIILFISANKVRDQTLNNLMYSFAAVSIVSLLLRAITIVEKGVTYGLLTDNQMWIFPICTIITAGIVWMTKQ